MVNHRQCYPTCGHGPQNASTRHRLFFVFRNNLEIPLNFMVNFVGAIGIQRALDVIQKKVTCEYKWVMPRYQQTNKPES